MKKLFMVTKNKKIVLFIIASVFFGGTFVGARAGLDYIPPILFVSLRYYIASIVLIGYVSINYPISELIPKNKSDIIGIFAAGILAIGAANGFLFLGQIEVKSSIAAIVFSLIPIFSLLLASFILEDERLTFKLVVGTIVSLIGVSFVINITPTTILSSLTMSTLFVLLGAFCTSLGSVIIRKTNPVLSSTARIAWALPISAIMLHIISFQVGESVSNITWNSVSIISLLYVGIFAGAVAYVAYFELLNEVGAMKSSFVFYISPVVATIGGWFFLGESITINSVIGFIIIFVGFVIIGLNSIQSIFISYFKRDKSTNISFSD